MKKSINQSTLSFILNGISILALLFLVFSLLSYSSISGKLDLANENRFALTYNANRFMNGSAYLTNEVRAFASTGQQEHYDNYWNEVNVLQNRDRGVAAMQEIGITSEEQKMIDDMSELSNTLVPLEDEAMKNVQAGNMQAALDYVYGEEYSASIAQINALKEQFLEALDERTKTQVETLGRESDFIRATMIAALIIVAVIQLLIMVITKRRVLRPVIAVRDQMSEISQGNLSAEFLLKSNTSEIGMLVESIHETKRELKKYINDIDNKLAQMAQGNMNLSITDNYRGEFLPIQNALSQILDSLNEALLHIHQSAQEVSAESQRVASGAQTLSEGAIQQASTVEELSADIRDISDQVNRTSKDADKAKQSTADAGMHLQLCSRKMDALMAAISDISQSSQEITGITKTIQDISFQTNILALNASVEAARVGEAGKGFAVVADEVQNLASKSAESAKNITELIENSVRLVQLGTALSTETTQALSMVVDSSQQSADLVAHIAESAQQQSQSLRQLTAGMDLISGVVQTNAATAQESASSAEELYRQAEKMKVSVQQFKLRG